MCVCVCVLVCIYFLTTAINYRKSDVETQGHFEARVMGHNNFERALYERQLARCQLHECRNLLFRFTPSFRPTPKLDNKL